MLLERFEALRDDHARRTRELLPAGTSMWDAHTHLGLDEDGMSQTVGTLLETMAAANVQRAFTFALNDPDRAPGYRVPNDRVLEWSRSAPEKLLPFCRLDLAASPTDEARRCLDMGARGIKLHPRAQAFDFGERLLDPVFAMAAERRVPILIHAGRGLPPIADDLQHLVERHPDAQLILAHAAIADLEQIGRTLLDHPNVAYDTSVWSVTDLRALLSVASPEQILWASDLPYGDPEASIMQLTRLLHSVGALAAWAPRMFWANAERVARGQPAADLTAPLAPRNVELSLQRMRISDYLAMAASLLWMSQPDRPGMIGLAVRACDADGAGELGECAELISVAGELWTQSLESGEGGAGSTERRAAFRLLQIALSLVHTT